MIGNKTRSRTQMQKNFREMTQPKSKQPKDLAAAASDGGGFAGVRPGRNGSADRPGDQEDGNQITVRSRRGAVVLDIEHDGDGATATLKPERVAGLISGLSAALAGKDTDGDPVGVRSEGDGIALEIADGDDLVEILIDSEGAANLIGRLGSALAEAQAA